MATWKEAHRGTVYAEGTWNPTLSSARISGHVYGLADTRGELDTAITTAIAAVGYVHPDNSNLPLKRVTARWGRGDPGATDALRGIAEVDLEFSLDTQAWAANANDFDYLCNVRVDTVPWQTHEADTFACWKSGGLNDGSYIGTTTGVTPNFVKNPQEATAKDSVPMVEPYMASVVEWTISVPISTTSSPVSWSSALAGNLNSTSYTMGGYAFPKGTLRHVGVNTDVYKFYDGMSYTYEFRTNVVYKHRPKGFYRTYFNHTAASDSNGNQTAKGNVLGVWDGDLVSFTDPPGIV